MTESAASPGMLAGPRPGLLGDVAAMHGRYYARHWGFPVFMEYWVASEMAAFFNRYDPARDLVLSIETAGRVAASITLDGSDPALAPGEAHLRWFIIDEAMQGRGLGKQLLAHVVTFARGAGFRSIYLITFAGLDAAAALYTTAGFNVVASYPASTWGREVTEQRLELSLSP